MKKKTGKGLTCAYCCGRAQGNYSIHRDGFGVGPEVPLCDGCGQDETPTCEEIWARISRDPQAQDPPPADSQDSE